MSFTADNDLAPDSNKAPSTRLIRTFVRTPESGQEKRSPLKRPVGTNWHLLPNDSTSGFILRQRGRWTLRGFGILLFATGFWNGITWIIVWESLLKPGVQKWTWDWMQTALFMGLFVLVGLAFVALSFIEFLEIFRTTTWWFEPDQIRCRYSYAGIGKSWTYPEKTGGKTSSLEEETIFSRDPNQSGWSRSAGKKLLIERVELHLSLWGDERKREGRIRKRIRRGDRTAQKLEAEWKEVGRLTKEDREQGIFLLRLFDEQGEQICDMGNLRLADAEWLGEVIVGSQVA